MKIRLAQNSDGPRIGELARASGFGVDGLDWSDIYPHWLVAERDDPENDAGVVAAIQVSLGKPIGRLEMLVADRGLGHRERALVVRELLLQGLATLRQSGAQVAMGVLPFGERAYKRLLKRRGAVVAFSGNAMLKRL